MDIQEKNEFDLMLSNTIWGLTRLGLIEVATVTGENDLKELHCQVATVPGILFRPSVFGIEFYMWVHGYSDKPHFSFFEKDTQFTKTKLLDIPNGSLPANQN